MQLLLQQNNISRSSMDIPAGITDEDFLKLGKQIHDFGQAGCWWMADWALAGRKKEIETKNFGLVKNFAEAVGLAYGTLRNLASIAEEFEPSRRRETLSFGHHLEVSALEPDEQEKWLDRASAEKLSCKDLRKLIRTAKADFAPEETNGEGASILGVEKVLMEIEIFFERNEDTIRNSADYLWDVVSPGLARMAKMWPDKLQIND